MERVINDKELGTIVVKKNLRAKRYIFRARKGQIEVTIPKHGSEHEMLQLLYKNRDKIRKMFRKESTPFLLDEDSKIQTYTFRLNLFRSSLANYYVNLKEGILNVACPADTNFESELTQQKLLGIFKKALKQEAIRVLPLRLNYLASKEGFDFSSVCIRDNKSRWGSCSSQKQINLSLSLMLLPEYLIDYVLLHELCHTVEMNHSDRFWKLMDRVTGNKAKEYRRDLRKYTLL